MNGNHRLRRLERELKRLETATAELLSRDTTADGLRDDNLAGLDAAELVARYQEAVRASQAEPD